MGAPREASMGIGEYALENRWHALACDRAGGGAALKPKWIWMEYILETGM